MSFGRWLFGASIFLNVTLVITVFSLYRPDLLQDLASRVAFWQPNPEFALLELYGILYTVAGLVAALGARSIRGESLPNVRA